MTDRGRATLKLVFRGGRLPWCAKESRAITDLCSLQILLLESSRVFLVYLSPAGSISELQFLYLMQWKLAGLWGGRRRGAVCRILTQLGPQQRLTAALLLLFSGCYLTHPPH